MELATSPTVKGEEFAKGLDKSKPACLIVCQPEIRDIVVEGGFLGALRRISQATHQKPYSSFYEDNQDI